MTIEGAIELSIVEQAGGRVVSEMPIRAFKAVATFVKRGRTVSVVRTLVTTNHVLSK